MKITFCDPISHNGIVTSTAILPNTHASLGSLVKMAVNSRGAIIWTPDDILCETFGLQPFGLQADTLYEAQVRLAHQASTKP